MSIDRPTRKPRRSFWARVFIAGLMLLSLAGWLRLHQSIVNWDYFVEIGLQPGPLYLALTGTLAGIAGLAAGISLWLHLRWSIFIAGGVILLWQTWNWVDRLWIASSPTVLANWPFALAATLVILAYTYLVLREEWSRK
jgi:hypothetical protein